MGLASKIGCFILCTTLAVGSGIGYFIGKKYVINDNANHNPPTVQVQTNPATIDDVVSQTQSGFPETCFTREMSTPNDNMYRYYITSSEYAEEHSQLISQDGDYRSIIDPSDETLTRINQDTLLLDRYNTDEEKARAILDFVQGLECMDTVYSDRKYAKHPVQTLAEGNGDEQDLAVLCASLMLNAGIPTILGVSDGHVVPLVHGKFSGLSEEYHGRSYYPADCHDNYPLGISEFMVRDPGHDFRIVDLE